MPGSSVDRRLYRSALLLCPPEFRDDYAAEMLMDFDAAWSEARATGRPADVWRLRGRLAADLVRTIGVQWTRTRFPLIGLIAVSLPLVIAIVLTRAAASARFDDPVLDHPELIGVLVVTVTSILLIAATIALTVVSAHGLRQAGTRRPRR